MALDGHLSVRVPEKLKERLQQLADDDQRTLASYVHHVLAQHVRQTDAKPDKSRK
jgi:predicted DNA-binding protein